MDIPKSLNNIWSKVSADGIISKDDYNTLVKEAAPNGLPEEIDKTEEKFLEGLYSKLSKSVNKGEIPVSEISLSKSNKEEKVNIIQVDKNKLSDIPDTLKEKWKQVISDNKITPDEYKLLLEIASPNWKDEELDDKEKAFLSNIKSFMSDANIILELKETPKNIVVKKDEPKTNNSTKTIPKKDIDKIKKMFEDFENEPELKPAKKILTSRLDSLLKPEAKIIKENDKKYTSADNSNGFNIPNNLKPLWNEISKKGSINTDDFEKLKLAASPNMKNSEFDDEEINFLAELYDNLSKNDGSISLKNSNSSNDTKIDNSNGFNIPNNLKPLWNEISKKGSINTDDFEKLKLAASPNMKNSEFDDEEINFLAELYDNLSKNDGSISLKNSNSSNDTKIDNSNGFNIPNNLKPLWNEISKKGSINTDDFEKLKLAASPNMKNSEFDDEEITFLAELYDNISKNDGSISLKNSNLSNTEQINSSKSKYVMLLNWPGYNKETKSALKNSFPNDIIVSKDIPLLSTKKGKEISNLFNTNSIMDLQKLIGAKADGKFGPETFFKIKVHLASQINNNANKDDLLPLLNSLGKDKEIIKMKEFLTKNI